MPGGQKDHTTKAVLFTFMAEREGNNGLVALQDHVRCQTVSIVVNFPTWEEEDASILLVLFKHFIDIYVPILRSNRTTRFSRHCQFFA